MDGYFRDVDSFYGFIGGGEGSISSNFWWGDFRKNVGGGEGGFCCFMGVFEGCFGKNGVLMVVKSW